MVYAGFADALARKYDIQQEQADSSQRLSTAQSGLTNAQAAAYPDEARARNIAALAQARQSNALGGYYDVRANLAPSEVQSENQLRSAQGYDEYARGDLARTQSAFIPQDFNRSLIESSNTRLADPNFHSAPGNYNPLHYAMGTERVPGQGDGKTDTTPAMLAPGEAVLNRAAAEHLGRGVIDMLNAIGAHKMGLDLNPNQAYGQTPGEAMDKSTPAKGSKDDSGQKVNNQSGGTPGYAKGTSKVPGKGAKGKAAPSAGGGQAPGPMSPEIMQAIMSLGGGAGGAPAMGMPSPQGVPPMPMPMPQVAR